MKTDPNAPAVPQPWFDGPHGLSIRQEFAKSQMAALTVACAHCFPPSPGEPLGAKWIRLRGWLALLAVEQADALIAELNKTP